MNTEKLDLPRGDHRYYEPVSVSYGKVNLLLMRFMACSKSALESVSETQSKFS